MSYTKDEIYAHITDLLQNLFEVDKADIAPEARLNEDLDIDSIDAADLMIELKSFTGKKIPPENFKDVRTVQDVIDTVARLLDDGQP